MKMINFISNSKLFNLDKNFDFSSLIGSQIDIDSSVIYDDLFGRNGNNVRYELDEGIVLVLNDEGIIVGIEN